MTGVEDESHRFSECRFVMSGIIMQFVGFESKEALREYTFMVREGMSEAQKFTLTIANEAFDAHRVRYQDAPDVCSVRLRHELAAHANHPPGTRFQISDLDLDDYRNAHPQTPRGRPPRPER
jgi:hypothetical protein